MFSKQIINYFYTSHIYKTYLIISNTVFASMLYIRSNCATVSTCVVCGNISTGVICVNLYWFANNCASRCCVDGLHDM